MARSTEADRFIRDEPDLSECLRRILDQATALEAVGTKFTKPYAQTIAALATRAYDLNEASEPTDFVSAEVVPHVALPRRRMQP